MTNEQKIGRKMITTDIVDGFSSALEKLEKQAPEITWSATALIKKHADQINSLIENGYKMTQITAMLKSELKLDISASLIRRALNTTAQDS